MQVDQTEVFHSVETMLHKPHKVDCRGDQESYRYEEVRPKV